MQVFPTVPEMKNKNNKLIKYRHQQQHILFV